MPLGCSNAHRKGNAIIEFAVASTVLLPMFFGTLAIGLNLGRNLQVTQLSRDVAVMYSRGIDFSKPASQSIAQTLASGFQLSSTGNAVVILSQVSTVTSADCQAGGFGEHCANEGSPVFLNRIVIGNASLRSSNFGSPVDMNAQGNIPSATYLDNPASRGNSELAAELAAADVAQRQGEVIYLVESYVDTPALNPFGTVSSRGVYAKAIF